MLSPCDGFGTVGKLLDLLCVYLNTIQHHITVDVNQVIIELNFPNKKSFKLILQTFYVAHL